MALRPLFPFRQAQYVQVFPLGPASFCKLFAGLSNTNKSATSLLLLSDSRFVLVTLSSQTLWQIWQELYSFSSCFIRLRGAPGHSFLPRNDVADELARRGALLLPSATSAIPCSLSPLISHTHSCHFSDWRRLSHRNSLTHRFPRLPPRNLCSLVMLAVFSLVFTATDTAFFQVLISPGLAELRILPAAPVDTRPRTPLISFCTVQLQTFAPLTLWRLSVSLELMVQNLGSCPASGAPWSSTRLPSLGRGWVSTITTKHFAL